MMMDSSISSQGVTETFFGQHEKLSSTAASKRGSVSKYDVRNRIRAREPLELWLNRSI